MKRSSDLWDARGGYESTTETAHGLVRLEADQLVIQWRLAVQTEKMGDTWETSETIEPVKEIVIPLAKVAGAPARRPCRKRTTDPSGAPRRRPGRSRSPRRIASGRRMIALQSFGSFSARSPTAFDSVAARAYAEIAAEDRHAGRPIGEADCQIAAISRARGATLVTRNVRDFDGTGLDVIDPWSG